jgi:hypothetical protein
MIAKRLQTLGIAKSRSKTPSLSATLAALDWRREPASGCARLPPRSARIPLSPPVLKRLFPEHFRKNEQSTILSANVEDCGRIHSAFERVQAATRREFHF